MNGLTLSSELVSTVMTNASTSSGHGARSSTCSRASRVGSSGLERSSHICRPSSETPGKMNRAATAASTNPARPRLRNEMMVTRLNGIRSPEWIGSGADVEDVDHQQHRQQDQLAPLGVVPEEEPHVLEQELALGDRAATSCTPADRAAQRPAHLALRPFLRLGVAQPEQPLVNQRCPSHQRDQRRAPEPRDRRTDPTPAAASS